VPDQVSRGDRGGAGAAQGAPRRRARLQPPSPLPACVRAQEARAADKQQLLEEFHARVARRASQIQKQAALGRSSSGNQQVSRPRQPGPARRRPLRRRQQRRGPLGAGVLTKLRWPLQQASIRARLDALKAFNLKVSLGNTARLRGAGAAAAADAQVGSPCAAAAGWCTMRRGVMPAGNARCCLRGRRPCAVASGRRR
jgi:hypothetical protein